MINLRTDRNGGTRWSAPLRLLTLLSGLLLLSGCTTPPDPMDDPLLTRFFLEARTGEKGIAVQLPVSRIRLVIDPKPVFVETDIVDAALMRVDVGWCLMVQFTPAAARDLYRMSVNNIGRRLLISFNDQPGGVRRIDQAMPEGALLMFIEVDDVNLPPLVERLKRTSAKLAK
jgi:hypothetical protein